jgi:carboxylesterase type B
MISTIKRFASDLTDEDLSDIFALYTPDDFHSRLIEYEAAKSEDDSVVYVHYFRLARILRDLLFTCSSIDLGLKICKQSRQADFKPSNVWLYILNQSMLTPLWKEAGMDYVGVSHGSDTNYLFRLFPEGKIQPDDYKLADSFAKAFIQFVSTGDPNNPEDSDWPEACVKLQIRNTLWM